MQYTCPHCNKAVDVSEGGAAAAQVRRTSWLAVFSFIVSVLAFGALMFGIWALNSEVVFRLSTLYFFICFVVAGPVLGIVMVLLGAKARVRIAKSGGRLKGSALASFGLFLGAVFLALLPIVIMLPGFVVGPADWLKPPSTESNLRNIGEILFTYARIHEDRYPPSLQTLLEEKVLCRKKFLENPSREHHDPDGDYAYVAGLTLDAPDDLILAYEKVDDPSKAKGLCVLLPGVYRRVVWMEMEEFQEALEKTNRWLAEHGPRP